MTEQIHPVSKKPLTTSVILFLICLVILVGAMALASAVQKDFGNVRVSNVTFRNFNGIAVRAKLLQPRNVPMNMLMVIGKWDEFRDRMTHTRDIEKEWMKTEETRSVISHPNPQIGVTYGDFEDGTARRVVVPNTIHIQESHSRLAITESLLWMKQALSPPTAFWIDPDRQIWPVKEWATLMAMLAGLWSLIPLGSLLVRMSFFSNIQAATSTRYACRRNTCFRYALVNGLLMWLYLPLIFVLFGIHIYIVRIDKAFPMMMVNAIVWWFMWVNVIGFFLFQRWFKKNRTLENLSLADLGISYKPDYFFLHKNRLAKTALLAFVLFGFAYLSEHLLEQIFIVDYRFIFPFASDLTPYRLKMALLYFPFLLLGFLQTGVFLHGQMRRPERPTPIRTFFYWSWTNITTMVLPILLFMAVQYIPLFLNGFIPLVGPGGMFVSFVINLFHIIGVLIVVIPLSTWLFQLTGKIYLGAMTSAALVSWMFASSQVIAPIPI